jgi:hypothetical protein
MSAGGVRPSNLHLLREVPLGPNGGDYENYLWDVTSFSLYVSEQWASSIFRFSTYFVFSSLMWLPFIVVALKSSSQLSHVLCCRLNQQEEFCRENSLYSCHAFSFSSTVSTLPTILLRLSSSFPRPHLFVLLLPFNDSSQDCWRVSFTLMRSVSMSSYINTRITPISRVPTQTW